MQTGDVQQEWRDALIVPLFKKGNRSDPCNYRPVSLTSVVCKVMKRIVKDNVVEHLNECNVIKGSQHGFTKGRSCLTILLEFFEEVYERIDEGKPVDGGSGCARPACAGAEMACTVSNWACRRMPRLPGGRGWT